MGRGLIRRWVTSDSFVEYLTRGKTLQLTLLLGNVLWKGSIAKGSDFAGEDDKPSKSKIIIIIIMIIKFS